MNRYNEAAAEAYASQDVGELTLFTFELHHPSFIDDNNERTAIRIVVAYEDFEGRLERTAPLDPGKMVTFKKCAIEFGEPGFEEGKTPVLPISISGISRHISGYLEAAIANPVPIDMYYRPYLASDPEGPTLEPPYHFQLTEVTVDSFVVNANCHVNDVHNWPFPAQKYTRERFPGLVRQ